MDDLVRQLTASGNLRSGRQGMDDLYDRFTVVSARDPRDVTIHGRHRANLDRDTGDAAMSWLNVHPDTEVAKHVRAPESNRTTTHVNNFVYAGRGAKAVERNRRKTGVQAPVYIGLARGVARGNGRPGVEVAAVAPGSPLARAGVRPGDVVLAVAQHRLENVQRLREVSAGLKPGKPYLFRIERNGQLYKASVTPDEPGTAT